MRHPPKFVQQFIDRNGKPRFYLRRPGFKSVPLPGLPWSPQFMEVYEAALSGQPSQIGASRTKPGTVSAAIIGYYYDQSFLALAPSTQRPLRGILERFRAEHGDKRSVRNESHRLPPKQSQQFRWLVLPHPAYRAFSGLTESAGVPNESALPIAAINC